MASRAAVRLSPDEDGFTLIEVVVAMIILALVSIALLPLLIQGVKQTSSTATIATAVQTVQDQMDAARAAGGTCAAIASVSTTANAKAAAVDARGVSLKIADTASTCPLSTVSGVVLFTTKVTRTDTGATLAKASTYIYVTG